MSNRDAFRFAFDALRSTEPVTLVTVAAVQGSAPREVGACMAVGAGAFAGTVGGGRLEWQAIENARALDSAQGWHLQPFTLNADIGQCCGGKLRLLFERLNPADRAWLETVVDNTTGGSLISACDDQARTKRWTEAPYATALHQGASGIDLVHPVEPGAFDVLLFGAGHVGQAVARLFDALPARVHQVDTREGYAADGVDIVSHPESVLREARPGTLVLVMTHDHALDYRITECALETEQVAWVGLIGSNSKRAQLQRRMARRLGKAVAEARLDRLACPIGPSIDSRAPAEMAAIIVAECLVARDAVNRRLAHADHATCGTVQP
ncbi:MAG: xanthine dehydrogenase accessory protein XdhC [Pseudomonadota bacterium]